MTHQASLYKVLHADAWLLALDKPSGRLAVPGRGEHLQACLASDVQAEFPGALNVHRLDRDTSGVIVMARDAETHRALSRQFEARTVEKTYDALVAGVVIDESGTIDLPLARDLSRPPRHRVDAIHGRQAITQWRVLSRGETFTRLELRPLTGRSHQLRVHLAEIGHPILGDPLYASEEVQAMYSRLALHATRLTIEHPESGERVRFESAAQWDAKHWNAEPGMRNPE